MTSNENPITENPPTEEEQTLGNKVFRIICMTFCLGVTVLFIWVWHHQTQFNDHYRKATFLMHKGEANQAIEAYQKAIQNKTRTIFFTKDSSVSSAYNNLGHLYASVKEYAPAIESFQKAIEIAPDITKGYINLTTAYLAQNLAAEAREACLRALQTFPKTARLHYNLACAYALEDKSQKAIDSLTQAVNLNPELKTFAQQDSALKGIVPELP